MLQSVRQDGHVVGARYPVESQIATTNHPFSLGVMVGRLTGEANSTRVGSFGTHREREAHSVIDVSLF